MLMKRRSLSHLRRTPHCVREALSRHVTLTPRDVSTDAEPFNAKRARFQTAEGAAATTGGHLTSEALRVTHADPTDDHTPRQLDEPNTPFDGEPTRRHTTVTSPAPDGPPLVAAAEAAARRSVDTHVESPRPKDDDPLKDENRTLRQEIERLETQTDRGRTEIEAYRAALHYHSLNELQRDISAGEWDTVVLIMHTGREGSPPPTAQRVAVRRAILMKASSVFAAMFDATLAFSERAVGTVVVPFEWPVFEVALRHMEGVRRDVTSRLDMGRCGACAGRCVLLLFE